MDINSALDTMILGFQHNSKLADHEPSWGSVSKTKLPRAAFADRGEADKKSSWKYPHHWVSGGKVGDDGVFSSGTMYLHRGGLEAALQAAGGARSGQKAGSGVVAHLRRHAAAIGMGKEKTAAAMGISVAELESMDVELMEAGLMTEADFQPVPLERLAAYLQAPCGDCY